MKNTNRLNLFLLPTMIFTLNASAFAKAPESSSFSTLIEMSEKSVDTLLDYRNVKGERFFVHPAAPQTNLWSMLDPIADQIEGTSTEKTYLDPRFPKAGKEIIVAVIDSGVDIKHEDLQGRVWVNTKEIPGNGIDDDKNGYIDDVNGWNFLGNKKGQNVAANTLEVTRELVRLTKKNSRTPLRGAELNYFNEIKKAYADGVKGVKNTIANYQGYVAAIDLLKANGLQEESLAGLSAVTVSTPEVNDAKLLAYRIFSRGMTSADLKDVIADQQEQLDFGYNTKFNSSSIVGDSASLNEIGYGNGDVTGPDAKHGTHVAGIIAANRTNNLGILGQADSVKIMSVRAVPNGDERDKDVANAILYAVNNGAKVINMSFGKAYSPSASKNYVDQAVAYAEKKGVILVHAAGNSGKNTETGNNNFPNKRLFKNTRSAHLAKNWIEVGASSALRDENLPAEFSNWGKTSVDLFAPGVSINSTIPGNRYANLQGTSMASPEVAGVAALLLGHFPGKTPAQVMDAMMKTTTQYPSLVVIKPMADDETDATKVNFSTLSVTGGIVNTFSAMEALLK